MFPRRRTPSNARPFGRPGRQGSSWRYPYRPAKKCGNTRQCSISCRKPVVERRSGGLPRCQMATERTEITERCDRALARAALNRQDRGRAQARNVFSNNGKIMKLSLRGCQIGIVGLGYVGLPLAVEFGKHFDTVGFDVKPDRIAALKAGRDSTLETTRAELKAAVQLSFTTNLADLKKCRVFIVTVPTPIDQYNRPDLTPLVKASESVGKVLKKGDVVVYESTVYPGCTEEVCVPILERESGLKFNKDFFAGYSPERINPGDKQHRLPTIKKITSGSTPDVGVFVEKL